MYTPRLTDRFAQRPGIALATAALLVVGAVASGCGRYMIGNRSLYPADIQTVYVPMFDSTSFRRNLGERLTEAVVKEIELKTPYKVVGPGNADSVLTGRIINETKGVVVEAPTDEPRYLQVNLRVEVNWTDRRGAMLRQTQPIPVPGALLQIDQTTSLTPEVGQSISTAQQQAIQRLAEQIVSLMEAPW